jgi:DNA-binding winged helix-turn-helix (wHTH) protein
MNSNSQAPPKVRPPRPYRPHAQKTDLRIYHFATFSIDIASREIIRGGIGSSMEPRAFDMLRFLIENRDRVLPKDDLVNAVWGDCSVSKSVLARAVMKARRAIGDVANDPRIIKTVHGVGYRFCAELLPGKITMSATSSALPLSRLESAVADQESRFRFAFLPFIGDASEPLGWEELGMLARITLCFQERSLLTAVPYMEVARVFRESAKDLTVLEMGSLLRATRVVRGRSRATSDGGWEFIFQCYNFGKKVGEGRRLAAHRGQLATMVAEAISNVYQLGRNDDGRHRFAVDL